MSSNRRGIQGKRENLSSQCTIFELVPTKSHLFSGLIVALVCVHFQFSRVNIQKYSYNDRDAPESKRNSTIHKNETTSRFFVALTEEWTVFSKNVSETTKTIINVFGGSPIPEKDVTLAVQGTVEELVSLQETSHRWQGPISVALFMSKVEDVLVFREYSRFHGIGNQERIQFHLLWETPQEFAKHGSTLPSNALRNLARQQTTSTYVLEIDMDVIPSTQCYRQLRDAIVSTTVRRLLNDATLVVISSWDASFAELDPLLVPRSYEDLTRLGEAKDSASILTSQQMPFLNSSRPPRVSPDCKAHRWVCHVSNPHQLGYEPYVLARRDHLPWYPTDLRGWNQDRSMFFIATFIHDFKFKVLNRNDAFLVRTNSSLASDSDSKQWFDQEYDKFLSNLRENHVDSRFVVTVDPKDLISTCPHKSTTETRHHSLLCEWYDFAGSVFHHRRQVPRVFAPDRRTTSFNASMDVSIVTHVSLDRLERLLDVVSRWSGPISVAVYITSEDHLRAFFVTYTQHKSTFKEQVIFHFFFEKIWSLRDKAYPHNFLRNLAMDYVETDYFIPLDADFVTNEKAYPDLMRLLHKDLSIKRALDDKTALILPAFESTTKNYGMNISSVPSSKNQINELVKGEIVQGFHMKTYARGHRVAKFEKWYENKSPAIYDTAYNPGMEPYFLVKRQGLPPYWTGFRGFGYNKKAWVEHIFRLDYKFAVLRDFFVFHVGNSATDIFIKPWNHVEKQKFDAYLYGRV